jgi:hypothetical protein
MSLAGRIEEIELAEILHFLALNSRTGKLTLSRRDAHGMIVLRLGRVLYAVSSSIRETLGSLLVCRGLVTPTALAGALERQHASGDRRKLGVLLVESGAITAVQLHEALWQQTALVVQELCAWRSGYFGFEISPVASSGDIGVDIEDLVVSAGVPTDQLLLEAMTRIDEGHPAEQVPSALDIVSSARAPALRGEVTAGLLRRAASVVRRGLLMVVRADEVQGIGQVGLATSEEPDALSRAVRLPLGQPSAIAEAVERRATRRGPLIPTPLDLSLLDALGGQRPSETLVVPMLLHDRGGLLFYGDDAGEGRPLGDAGELEWALLEAGLAMEHDMLEQRLRDFERARGYRP